LSCPDLEGLLRDNACLVVRLDAAHVESKRLDNLHELHRTKIANHVRQITEREQESMPIYEELRNQQLLVNGLMAKSRLSDVRI